MHALLPVPVLLVLTEFATMFTLALDSSDSNTRNPEATLTLLLPSADCISKFCRQRDSSMTRSRHLADSLPVLVFIPLTLVTVNTSS
ncbi:hypothetical protein BC835DRAFT_342074 [Cytidiella melzeri]|nr:hypothetical protein BC835DRAFT_342074 [Cytidiella melzeri]